MSFMLFMFPEKDCPWKLGCADWCHSPGRCWKVRGACRTPSDMFFFEHWLRGAKLWRNSRWAMMKQQLSKHIIPNFGQRFVWATDRNRVSCKFDSDSKATPKRVKKNKTCMTLCSLLDPYWTGLEAILGPFWDQKSGSRLTFSNV